MKVFFCIFAFAFVVYVVMNESLLDKFFSGFTAVQKQVYLAFTWSVS